MEAKRKLVKTECDSSRCLLCFASEPEPGTVRLICTALRETYEGECRFFKTREQRALELAELKLRGERHAG